jgi:hypothetical protein
MRADEVRATGILQAHYLRPLELNKPVDADWALVCHNLQVCKLPTAVLLPNTVT